MNGVDSFRMNQVARRAVELIKKEQLLALTDIKDAQRFIAAHTGHGAGVQKLIAGTNIAITSEAPAQQGLGNITIDATGIGGGTVTSVSVVTANGISGTVATATTTPAITLDISALDAIKIADGSVTNAEFQYLGGVTSAIQTQLDAKGTGDVTKVGTPVNNQLGVWTGDGTIEGDADLTWNSTTLAIAGNQTITVADEANLVGLTINQNDVTNDLPAAIFASQNNLADSPTVRITSTNASNNGPQLELYHDSASPSTSDYSGVQFFAKNSAGTKKNMGGMYGQWNNVSDTFEEGMISLFVTTGGIDYNTVLEISAEGLVPYYGIASNLTPSVDNGYSLGESSLEWTELYLNGGSSQGIKFANNLIVSSGGTNTLAVGDGTTNSTVESNGNSDLVLRTGNATTGSITITDGANGNISLTPNGTGRILPGTQVLFAATTTAQASFNLPTGTAPSSPVDGDVWREDNTDTGLKIRVNGVTKTITLS